MKIKIIIAFILLFAGIANAGDAAVERTDYKSARTVLVKIKTFMKWEYDYLLSKGYVLQETGLMIKP